MSHVLATVYSASTRGHPLLAPLVHSTSRFIRGCVVSCLCDPSCSSLPSGLIVQLVGSVANVPMLVGYVANSSTVGIYTEFPSPVTQKSFNSVCGAWW